MKCARLRLQERGKTKLKTESGTVNEKPRRYCQKRLVNPEHEEDPRWMDLWDRFHYNVNQESNDDTLDSVRAEQEAEDIVLTVQTLKFQGKVDQTKRPRTSFKYKTITDRNKHRMFVKQVITENEFSDDDGSSQLTSYYFDDYVRYLSNIDRSRPASSSKSSIFLKGVNTDIKENKATQVEYVQPEEIKKVLKIEPKPVTPPNKSNKRELKEQIKDVYETIENTKIAYEKTGKRKSLTLTRSDSPETVQVIRVDVVCNYPTSSILSNYEENKTIEGSPTRSLTKLKNMNLKKNHFADKYLLAESVKTLNESLSDGSKVTLLCKTFKLSDRSPKVSDKPSAGKSKKIKNDGKPKNRKKKC